MHGNSLLPPALGWVGRWRPKIQKRKTINCLAPLPPFCFSQKSKTENFLFPFEKNLGARHQKNVEKIFLFWD